MSINEKRFGDVKLFLIKKGGYSFKPMHVKTKTPVTQFYFARETLRLMVMS